jgi:hypothetical protein
MKREPGIKASVGSIHAMISPVVRASPLATSEKIPDPDLCSKWSTSRPKPSMISVDPSLLPPSTTTYSRLGYPCSITETIALSIDRAALWQGVTKEIFG